MIETATNTASKGPSSVIKDYVMLGNMLKKLIFLNTRRSFFEEYWQGDYRRTPSLYNAGQNLQAGILLYASKEETPPLAKLTDAVHSALRYRTAQLPMLDETALSDDTRKQIQALNNIIKKYQGEVQKTKVSEEQAKEKGIAPSAPDYQKIDPEISKNIAKSSDIILNILKESELAKAAQIPIEFMSEQGVVTSHMVDNDNKLGLYLLALSYAPHMLQDRHHVPSTISEFFDVMTGDATKLIKREVKMLLEEAPETLREATQRILTETNEKVKSVFRKQQQAMQIANIAVPHCLAEVLDTLQLPLIPQTINTPTEAAVLLDSLAEQTSVHWVAQECKPKPHQLRPLSELIIVTQEALEKITLDPPDYYGNLKVQLLQDYLAREQERAAETDAGLEWEKRTTSLNTKKQHGR